eukprot:TRINITY_DN4939_c0_g2_i1.p1 TRINITY_DN4939_c0_g2~~TRINITY_DN4939_c0_g2_i1.p1  ORF type:complete len:515 (+),score=71.02 TRINITY_DN4939_c0_g2_i1:54-1598(+)
MSRTLGSVAFEVALLLLPLTARAALCSNYHDPSTCEASNDGGCSCLWEASADEKSDGKCIKSERCDGFGITGVGGEDVECTDLSHCEGGKTCCQKAAEFTSRGVCRADYCDCFFLDGHLACHSEPPDPGGGSGTCRSAADCNSGMVCCTDSPDIEGSCGKASDTWGGVCSCWMDEIGFACNGGDSSGGGQLTTSALPSPAGPSPAPTAQVFELLSGHCSMPVTDEETCEKAAGALGLSLAEGRLGECRAYDGKVSFSQWGPCTHEHLCICYHRDGYATQVDSRTCEDHGHAAVTLMSKCQQAANELGFGKVYGRSGSCRVWSEKVSFADWGPCTHEHQCVCLPMPTVKQEVRTQRDDNGLWFDYQLITSGKCRAPVIEMGMCEQLSPSFGFSYNRPSADIPPGRGMCRVSMAHAEMSYTLGGDCSEELACVCKVLYEENNGFMISTGGECAKPVTDLNTCHQAVHNLGLTMDFLNEEEGPDRACRVYTPTGGTSQPSFSAWGACSISHPCVCYT